MGAPGRVGRSQTDRGMPLGSAESPEWDSAFVPGRVGVLEQLPAVVDNYHRPSVDRVGEEQGILVPVGRSPAGDIVVVVVGLGIGDVGVADCLAWAAYLLAWAADRAWGALEAYPDDSYAALAVVQA